MNKSTKNMLLIGGGLAVAYYLWKNSNPANAASVLTNPDATTQSMDASAAAIVQNLFNNSSLGAS